MIRFANININDQGITTVEHYLRLHRMVGGERAQPSDASRVLEVTGPWLCYRRRDRAKLTVNRGDGAGTRECKVNYKPLKTALSEEHQVEESQEPEESKTQEKYLRLQGKHMLTYDIRVFTENHTMWRVSHDAPGPLSGQAIVLAAFPDFNSYVWDVFSIAVERSTDGCWQRIGLMETMIDFNDTSRVRLDSDSVWYDETREKIRELFKSIRQRTILLA